MTPDAFKRYVAAVVRAGTPASAYAALAIQTLGPDDGPRFLASLGASPARAASAVTPPPPPPPGAGVGTEVKRLLAAHKLSRPGCGRCRVRADAWDRNGPAWCREHRDELAADLRAEAETVGWLTKLSAGASLLRESWFRVADPAGSIVDEAIRRAETQEQPRDTGQPLP